VTAYPLIASDGDIYLGESVREISVQDESALGNGGVRMTGESPAFLTLMEQLELIARSDVPALLLGETGTGKELAARFIHQRSARASGPFLTVDCTVLSESLVDNELFGHERGAYTGSVGAAKGLLELADGGTLFLDEMGELPASMQAKLLRVLETGEFRRIGGHQTLKVDVRVVCATNRHLWEAVRSRQFREDLYYRIACLTVHLPSLRERLQDIPLLAEQLLDAHSRSTGRPLRLTQAALDLLIQQEYRGNIRQLRNILYAGAAHSIGGTIEDAQIRLVLDRSHQPRQSSRERQSSAHPESGSDRTGMVQQMGDMESQHIQAVLASVEGNRRRAAARLGISTRTLYRKIKLYGLG
jgi:transcriptional regulator with GAF, ATPase, and Fis domain